MLKSDRYCTKHGSFVLPDVQFVQKCNKSLTETLQKQKHYLTDLFERIYELVITFLIGCNHNILELQNAHSDRV